MRDVVVRLKAASGVPPRGTIDVQVQAHPDHPQEPCYETNVVLLNGEARLAVPEGASLEYLPNQSTLGYYPWINNPWFKNTIVPAGDGPLVVDVPVLPAGIIAAHARNADGSPPVGLMFSVLMLKPFPAVAGKDYDFLDRGNQYSGNNPRQYVTGPLPLGGTYEILGWRDNTFCSSGPIELTEAAPDRVVELQMAPGQDLTGQCCCPTAGRRGAPRRASRPSYTNTAMVSNRWSRMRTGNSGWPDVRRGLQNIRWMSQPDSRR